jgi:hypothetical protein
MTQCPRTPEMVRLHQVVREAKRLRTYPDIVWASDRWEIKQYELNRRAHDNDTATLLFT